MLNKDKQTRGAPDFKGKAGSFHYGGWLNLDAETGRIKPKFQLKQQDPEGNWEVVVEFYGPQIAAAARCLLDGLADMYYGAARFVADAPSDSTPKNGFDPFADDNDFAAMDS